MTYYGQRDPQWSSQKLGTSNVTIGGYGCAITSLAMLCEYLGVSTTPSTLNTWLKNNDGFSNGNLVIWSAMNKYTDKLYYTGRKVLATADTFPQIAEVDLIPTNSKFDQHFVLALNKDECWDPWTNRKRPLSDFGGVKSYRIYSYITPVNTDPVNNNSSNSQGDHMNIVGDYFISQMKTIENDEFNPNWTEEEQRAYVDKIFRKLYSERKILDTASKLNTSLADRIVSLQEQLDKKPADAPTNTSLDLGRFTSRKFLLAVLAAYLPIANHTFGWNLSVETIITTIAPLMAFIGVEGWADANK